MDLLKYTPGTMSNTDFYNSFMNDAMDSVLFPVDAPQNERVEPLVKDETPYYGEVTQNYLNDYTDTNTPTSGSSPIQEVSYGFKPDMEWLNRKIPKWEGSSMITNVPIDTKVNEYLSKYPQAKYLNPKQNAALVSMYYNARPDTFDRTTGKYIKQLTGSLDDSSIYPAIQDSMRIGENRRNLPGLAKRRAEERAYFNSKAYGGNLYSGLDLSDSQMKFTPGNDGTSLDYNFGPKPTNIGNSSIASVSSAFNPRTDSQGFSIFNNAKYDMASTLGSLGKGVSSGIGSGAGSMIASLGNIGTGLLAGKNETGVGNAMKTIGTAASAIPGVGGLIGAGVAVLGGLTNAAFGSHINKAYVNNMQQQAGNQGSFYSKAQSSEQLLNDAQNLSYMDNVNKSDVGSDGWFSHKAARATDKLNDKINSANDRSYQSLLNTDVNVDKNTYNQLASNWSAYGGDLFDEGGPLKGNALNNYNTPIPESKLSDYKKFWMSLPKDIRNTKDYDMQGFFLSKGSRSSNGHFPDTYKKPNHETFSNESIYNDASKGILGGHWYEDNFIPSFYNNELYKVPNVQVSSFEGQPFYENGGILEGDFDLGNNNLTEKQIKRLKSLGYEITID